MKRLTSSLLATAVLGTSVGLVAVAPAASADGGLDVNVASAGTKKVDVSWGDWLAIEPAAVFDAYLVTLDNGSDSTPDTADRSRFVDDAAERSVRFQDLNANTAYYATVYAVDYQDDGVVVVPPDGQPAGTALGTQTASYSPLTISASSLKTLSGNAITLSGTLKPDGVAADGGEEVTVLADTYPPGDPAELTATVQDGGAWSVSSGALTTNTTYWAEYRDTDGVGGWTGRIDVEVRKKITLTLDPGATVPAGTVVKFSGTLGGDASVLGGVQVCVQRLRAGEWGGGKCEPAASDGTYLVKLQLGASADGKYRAWSGMGPYYGDSWSKAKKITTT